MNHHNVLPFPRRKAPAPGPLPKRTGIVVEIPAGLSVHQVGQMFEAAGLRIRLVSQGDVVHLKAVPAAGGAQ